MSNASDVPLILASQSPRRRELLAQAGYEFHVIAPDDAAESGERGDKTPVEYVSRLARQKAADVARRVAQGIVIGCDTIAECAGEILGKPRDVHHAREMLELLRGREHRVLSGLCLWRRPDDYHAVRVDITRLIMEPMTNAELDQYLDSGAWEGKAGAFGLQDRLGWIQILEGSESNVVGLPMEMLKEMLGDVGGLALPGRPGAD